MKKLDKKLKERSKRISSRNFLQQKIAISGSRQTGAKGKKAIEDAETLGQLVAASGFILVTNASTGIAYWAAKGAKEAGGFVLGISPAKNKTEHKKSHALVTDYHDTIIYTGLDEAGCAMMLARSADALLTIAGKTETLHEYSAALQEEKPVAVLEGSGHLSDGIRTLLKSLEQGHRSTVFAKTPTKLIEKLLTAMQ